MTYHAMPCHAMPCHAMPCHAMPCHAMPCHAMPCHAMPCHAMPCHAMPCHAMPCHAMPRHAIVSYSCMQNIKSKISNHNRRLLEKNKKSTADKNLNCRNKECCPLDNQCLTTNVIYKAEIKNNVCGDTKEYIGNTAGTFKRRYANHVKSLNIQPYSTETEPYKYAWKLKKNKRSYIIKWSIIKQIPAYTAGGNSCNLCLEEKLSILKSNRDKTLNKRIQTFV